MDSVVLLSVPYALKAGDAQTIGGLPRSAFLLAPSGAGTMLSTRMAGSVPLTSGPGGIKAPETEGVPPKGNMFYGDATGKVTIFGHEFNLVLLHGEGGDPNNLPTAQLIHSRLQQLDEAVCAEPDACQNK